MPTLTFERALLPDGWFDDVSISVDEAGDIVDVEAGSEKTPRISGCALPGVPNLHSHAHQRAMAGLAERSGPGRDSFWSWREAMYACTANIEPQHLEAIATQLYIEMLKAGYTAVAEFQYLHHDPAGRHYDQPAEMSLRTLAAARRAGIGLTCLPVLYRFGGFDGADPEPSQRRFINDLDGFLEILDAVRVATRDQPNSMVGAAPHSLRAVTPELLGGLLAATESATEPVHLHIAEQRQEVEQCLASSGLRPVEWLLAHFEIDDRWCLIHATHMTADETLALAGCGAVAGLCPTTEANLGDGIFKLSEYLSGGGRFGIGSDSHVSVSPVEELRWLEYGQRLCRQRRTVSACGPDRSTGRELFDRAVAGGAQACGRRVGRLQSGYRADVVVLDTDHPLLYGRDHDAVLDSWIFSGNVNCVRDVWVGGVQVVDCGTHIAEEAARESFQKVADVLIR